MKAALEKAIGPQSKYKNEQGFLLSSVSAAAGVCEALVWGERRVREGSVQAASSHTVLSINFVFTCFVTGILSLIWGCQLSGLFPVCVIMLPGCQRLLKFRIPKKLNGRTVKDKIAWGERGAGVEKGQ